MKRIALLLLTLIFSTVGFSQSIDTLQLFNQAKHLVETKKKTTNQLLTDTKFLPLHEYMPFHNLIKENATESKLALAWKGLAGIPFHLKLTFTRKNGKPFIGEKIYFFQTDSEGYYLEDTTYNPTKGPGEERARIFGYAKTDKKGRIFIETIRPESYPIKILDVILAPHIHMQMAPFKNEEFPNGKFHIATMHLVDNPKFGEDSEFQKKFKELGADFSGKWQVAPNNNGHNEWRASDFLVKPKTKGNVQYCEIKITMDE